MRPLATVLLALLGAASAARAATPAEIESVLVSRSGDTAEIAIRFACPNRYLNHAPLTAGTRSDVLLMRMEQCVGDSARESAWPAGRALAALEEMEYTATSRTDATLRLRFDRAVLVAVSQSGDLRSLRLRVQLPGVPAAQAAAEPPAPAASPPAAPTGLTPEQLARAEERARRASQPRPAAAAAPALFVINLRSTTEPIDLAREGPGVVGPGQTLYVADTRFENRTWHRLRLGFFPTEEDAHTAWLGLRARFPYAWVVKVDAAERAGAGAGATTVVAATPAGTGPAAMTDAQVAEALALARDAFIDQDYARTMALAATVVGEPPRKETAEARELLGVASERNGQVARAQAEYRRYLADYPDGEGADRVRQRLAALTTAREPPRESIRQQAPAARDSGWDVRGGLSQYYRRDTVDFGGDSGETTKAAVFTDADLVARRSGERFDVGSRATLGYSYDMSGSGTDIGNQSRIYNLYVDVNDRDLDVSARLGRQTLRNQGVLGRFDGAYLSWQWAPAWRLNLLGGYPVYAPDQDIDTSRRFYGFSVDALNLLDLFDLNVFVNIQTVDGVNDREAVGAELRYFDEHRSLVASVDYDYGYGDLNSAVALGNWTFDNRLTLNATLDYRKTPYLTTENALVEQKADSIQQLLLTYTEGQIRQLALDRTGSMQSFALGASRPLSTRFELSADVTVSQYTGTPASGGANETEDSDTLVYSYLSLIGTSLFKEGDVSVLGLRYSDSGASTLTALFLDSRYPLTPQLRINPRILVSWRDITAGDASETLIRPGIRLLYRPVRHFQLDVDAGSEFGTRDAYGRSNSSTGYYLYAGYRADF